MNVRTQVPDSYQSRPTVLGIGMTDKSIFHVALGRALTHALDHLDNLGNSSVAATAPLEALREKLGKPLNTESVAAERVIDDLVADVAGGVLGSAGGRFFGWVVGGSLPAALAADWLTSAWDQNAASYACGPAMAVIEEVCGNWLKELLGLPKGASFALTNGCQMAHATALAAARNFLLARQGWDVECNGLFGAPKIRILTGDQFHGSISRAARLLGLGTNSIHALPVDGAGKLEAKRLEEALREDVEALTVVLLQAGDLNIGAFDPFADLIPIAHRYGAWVHVDGAFGLWANTSKKYRHLLLGVDQADSWATDGHKWLNVPYDCGYAFVAHPQPHRKAMSYQASYVSHHEEAREQKDWNPEWSRRGRGVATYAAIRQLGRRGVAELIERNCEAAHRLVTNIGVLPGVQMMWEPQVNQGLVRFLDPRPGATDADHDARTDEITRRVAATGEAFFSNTTWRGKRCMRVSVCNWQTDTNDIERSIAAVQHALRQQN
jgi:glutamate/tyrosine decarboxylase-like PLP-dependent enzyme